MGHLKNFSKAEKQQHVYYYNSLGWAEAAKQKKCSLKSLSSAHVKPSDKILLLTAKSFLF